MKTNARAVIARIEKKMKQTLDDAPSVLANTGARHFSKSFERQGYGDDQTIQKWKPRKKETAKSQGKKILVSTGQLRRAVANSVRSVNGNRILWGVYLPYAEVHNNGYRGVQYIRGGRGFRKFKGGRKPYQVKPYARKMNIPARPFMKNGYILQRVLRKKLEQIFKSSLR